MPPSDSGSAERLDATIPGAFPPRSLRSPSPAISTTQQTLSQALFSRRSEYTRPRNVRIKVGSWNVAAQKGTEKDIGGWFVDGKGIEESLAGLGVGPPQSESTNPRESVAEQEARSTKYAPTIPFNDDAVIPGGKEVDIYALGLQEIVDIGSATEALRPYTDPAAANKWKSVVKAALPPGYELVAEQQLIGLLLLIYASPRVMPHIKAVSTTSVGTGLMGYMGNKGAVTARLVIGETTRLVFINAHLAAGADKAALDRRNWDVGQIISRTRFDPIVDALGLNQNQGEQIGEEDFAFWFGDLNYRLEGMPGDDVRRLLTVHTLALDEHEKDRISTSDDSGYGSKSSSETADSEDAMPLPPDLDPASLQTTINSLLPHDELQQQQKAGKAFPDWAEGPIRFLPTYKYDIGKVGVFDSSDKQRCPSWCDRILYRTRAAKLRYEMIAKDQEAARKKDEEMKAKGLDHATDDEDVLFDYDPETDGDNDNYDDYDVKDDPQTETVTTKEGFSDEILLEYYTAHMRVLSSDHKPLDAVFALKYDAVIPELKARIHQEVARDLDRQENEGRPSITVVVDRTARPSSSDSPNFPSDSEGVDYGDIQYAKSKRRNITIANTGRVPATFGFVDRPVENGQPPGPFPPWLTVTFDREPDAPSAKGKTDNLHEQYTLQPADVCNVELRLKVDIMETVRSLNEETSTLDEILVLRVLDGRDHFLPIKGRWLQSSLARSIDKLIRIPEGGIRKLQHQKPGPEVVKWSVPRELFRLTESLEEMTERALAEWSMTGHEGSKAPWAHNAGWPFVKDARYFASGAYEDELAKAFEALDCDTPFDKAFEPEVSPMQRLEVLAAVLLVFLKSLQDGIVTELMWKRIEAGLIAHERSKLSAFEERMSVLEVLSETPNHNASFVLLTTMLQSIARDVANACKPDPKTPRSSIDLPASPQVPVRRKTLSKVPEVAIRQLINRNYASVFADVVFRSEGWEKLREKDRAVRRERMIKTMELFLTEDDVGR
jgi:phosphatidylinositol-bisphosphatase